MDWHVTEEGCNSCVAKLPGPAPDLVNSPPHYTAGGMETIDFIEAKQLNYHLGNVVKYVTRAGKKESSEYRVDLEKAKWYLERAINATAVKPTKETSS